MAWAATVGNDTRASNKRGILWIIKDSLDDNIFYELHLNCLGETVLMMGHNIRFKGIIW